MARHEYGHRPPDIGANAHGMGWVRGIRHLASRSAKCSFWHRHGETSIICCLRGEYVYELHGLPAITLTAGSFLVVPAQVEHRHLKAVDPVGDRLEILLDPTPSKAPPRSPLDCDSCRKLHSAILRLALAPTKCGNDLLRGCRELYDLAGRAPRSISPEELGYARSLCHCILSKMANPDRKPAMRHIDVTFEEIAQWVERHLGEKIDIDRLVAHIGYSRTQVFTIFKDNTGLSPADFLTRLRVKKACSLLETSSLPACHIASACGFSSASLFNAVFRRQTGTSPISWRERNSAAR